MEDFLNDMEKGKTVEQTLDVDLEHFEELSQTSEYWNAAFNFYSDVSDKIYDSLSERQKDWLEKICEGLAEDVLDEMGEADAPWEKW